MSKAVRAMTMKSMTSVLFSLFFLSGFFLSASAQAAPSAKAKSTEASKAPTKPAEPEVKQVSGMSIMGNNDAPKSLYIVPWKSSELGAETEFKSSLLDESLMPVDKPVFQRELDFYNLSNNPPNSR